MNAAARPIAFAKYYAARGFPIFPLKPHDKIPLGRLAPHGCLDASTDPEIIGAWWTTEPEAGIGLRTGRASGTVAIDIDPRHGGDVSLAQLEAEHGPLPATVEAITGGGGRHLLFAYPAGDVDIKNCAGLGGLPGIDVRGEGGYIAVAPSIHPSGQPYKWRVDRSPKARKPAELPDWLLAMLTAPRVKATDNGHRVGGYQEGQRNHALARLAGTMRHGGCEWEDIEAALLVLNGRHCNPPLPEAEVGSIAKSIARYEPGDTAASCLMDMDVAAMLRDGIKPVTFDLDELLPQRSFIYLTGAPKGSKTWLALSWAVALASGRSFAGRQTRGEHRILFIEAERPRQIPERLPAVCLGYQANPASILERVRFMAPRGGLRLDDPAQAAFLHATAKEWGATWVIIDSFVRVHALNENDSSDMARLANLAFLPLRDDVGCGVLMLDHPPKPWPGGTRGRKEQIRGSWEKLAAADVQIHVEMIQTDDGRIAELSVAASRVAQEPDESIYVKLVQTMNGGLRFEGTDAPPDDKRPGRPGKVQKAINLIRAEQDKNPTLTFSEAVRACHVFDVSKSTAQRAWTEIQGSKGSEPVLNPESIKVQKVHTPIRGEP